MIKMRIPALLLTFSLLALLLNSSVIASDPFLGAETCGHCHKAQYEAWKNGPHSGSLYSLEPKYRSDPSCIGCHSATHANNEPTGIQCESCHGAGTHYARKYIMKDRNLAQSLGLVTNDYSICLQCHQGDLPCIKEFDAKKAWEKLPHSKTDSKSK